MSSQFLHINLLLETREDQIGCPPHTPTGNFICSICVEGKWRRPSVSDFGAKPPPPPWYRWLFVPLWAQAHRLVSSGHLCAYVASAFLSPKEPQSYQDPQTMETVSGAGQKEKINMCCLPYYIIIHGNGVITSQNAWDFQLCCHLMVSSINEMHLMLLL